MHLDKGKRALAAWAGFREPFQPSGGMPEIVCRGHTHDPKSLAIPEIQNSYNGCLSSAVKGAGMGASTPSTLVLLPFSILTHPPNPTHTSRCQEKPVEHSRQLTTSSYRTQLSTLSPLRQNFYRLANPESQLPGNFTCHLNPSSTHGSSRLYGDRLGSLKFLQFIRFHLDQHAFPKGHLHQDPQLSLTTPHHTTPPIPGLPAASADHISPDPPGPLA